MLDADRNISIVPMSQVSTSAEGWCCVQPDRSWEHVLCPFADNSGEEERSQYGYMFLIIFVDDGKMAPKGPQVTMTITNL